MTPSQKSIAPILRLTLGLSLLLLLLRSIGFSDIRSALAPLRAHPGHVAAALALTCLAHFAGAVRWHFILRTLALPTAFSSTFRAFFVGQFFNAFLFGACGGDLARAVLAARDHPEKRPEAVASVFLDRAIGLVLTLAFGCALLLFRIRDFIYVPQARPALLLMAAFLLAAAAFLALFFSRDLFDRVEWLRRRQHRGLLLPLLRRVYDALYLFRRNARHLLLPALLSLANLLLLAASVAALAKALQIQVAFIDLLAVFPVATVLAAIPLTPGGIGVRETLFVQLLAPFAVPPGHALLLSLLGYLAATLWSLFGGILFALPSRQSPP